MELGTIFPSASSSKQIQKQQLFNLFWNYQAMKVWQYSHIGNYPRVRRFYWFLAVQLNCNCLDLKSYWNQYFIFDSCNLFSKTISKSKSHVLTIPTNFPPLKNTKYYCCWKISGDHQLRERYFISLLRRNNTYQVVFSPEFFHPSVNSTKLHPKNSPFFRLISRWKICRLQSNEALSIVPVGNLNMDGWTVINPLFLAFD